MSEFKTLNVWDYSKQNFNVLAKKYGLQSTLLFDHMVKYFVEQNISPMDRSDGIYRKIDQMEKNLLKHVKAIIGFLRVQENDIILPVVHDSNRLVEQVGKLIEKHFVEKEEEKLSEMVSSSPEGNGNKIKEELEQDYRAKINFLKENLLKILDSLKMKTRLSGSKIELEGLGIQDIKRLKQACESI